MKTFNFDGPGDYLIEVVGESHYQANLARICGKRKEDGEDKIIQAVLILENSNPYDKNAVRVDIRGLTVGYLSRKHAIQWRIALKQLGHRQAAGVCSANIRGGWDQGNGDQGFYGVWLDLPAGEDSPAPSRRVSKKSGGGKLLPLLFIASLIAVVIVVVKNLPKDVEHKENPATIIPPAKKAAEAIPAQVVQDATPPALRTVPRPPTIDPPAISTNPPMSESPPLTNPIPKNDPLQRKWSIRTGYTRFPLEATLIEVKDGIATIRRTDNGKIVTFPIDQFSKDDQAFLQQHQ